MKWTRNILGYHANTDKGFYSIFRCQKGWEVYYNGINHGCFGRLCEAKGMAQLIDGINSH